MFALSRSACPAGWVSPLASETLAAAISSPPASVAMHSQMDHHNMQAGRNAVHAAAPGRRAFRSPPPPTLPLLDLRIGVLEMVGHPLLEFGWRQLQEGSTVAGDGLDTHFPRLRLSALDVHDELLSRH